MIHVTAYLLAADPAWIEASVLSYYDVVERIVVSFDVSSTGWSGAPIDVAQCLQRLRAVDHAKKLDFRAGDFSKDQFRTHPLDGETDQRRVALSAASVGADWVLQLDTDEILPSPGKLIEVLSRTVPADAVAVDWPMRTFFQRTAGGDYLEVSGWTGRQVSSFPGPIAVRPNATLKHCRQVDGKTFRVDIDWCDRDPAAGSRPVHSVIDPSDAILHMSWVRSKVEIEQKLLAWGHTGDFDWRAYLQNVWVRAPRRWMLMYNFHPFSRRWWPALRRVRATSLPKYLAASQEGSN